MRRKGWKPDGRGGYVRAIGSRFNPWVRLWATPTHDGLWAGSSTLIPVVDVRARTPDACAQKMEERLCDWLGKQSARLAAELEKRADKETERV